MYNYSNGAKMSCVLGDSSVNVIKDTYYGKDKYQLQLSGVTVDSIKHIPDCITFGASDDSIDRIVMWGDTKELYDTMGGEAFLQIATRTKK